ncbi:MAG: 50S ribosomal protein L9 [Candidatus Latescibacterota bacterium]|nr:MAG: 50S ribosomal protein L9 [Candidatus Latescibacterota bacterium]
MEVILLESLPPLGNRGDTVKVKPGYARNYLFPRKFAILATAANKRVFEESERVKHRRDIIEMRSAKDRAGKLADVSCTITVKVGEDDKLYGSVSAVDISKELANQGFEIEKRQVLLEEPIKKIGVYTVDVKLHREVTVPIKVWVVKQ